MPSASVSALMRLAESGGRGPSPSFTRAHFFLAFLTIGDRRTIGRQALARQAGLGEGAVRTVLKRLRDFGYAEAEASGCSLTKSGRTVHAKLRERLSTTVPLGQTGLTVGDEQAAIRVSGGARRLQSGIEQRDSAIMVGASGATTYAIEGHRFTVPMGSSDCEADFPSPVWERLKRELSPREGDVIVLCGADDAMKAGIGALSAALTLL